MLLVLCRSHSLFGGIPFAHVRAGFRVAVVLVGREVIDLRVRVGPDDRARAATHFGLRFRRILVGSGRSRCGWRRLWCGSGRSGSRRGRRGWCRFRRLLLGRWRGGLLLGRRGRRAAALRDVSLFRYALGLVVGLVCPPLFLTRLDGFLLGNGGKSQKRRANDSRANDRESTH